MFACWGEFKPIVKLNFDPNLATWCFILKSQIVNIKNKNLDSCFLIMENRSTELKNNSNALKAPLAAFLVAWLSWAAYSRPMVYAQAQGACQGKLMPSQRAGLKLCASELFSSWVWLWQPSWFLNPRPSWSPQWAQPHLEHAACSCSCSVCRGHPRKTQQHLQAPVCGVCAWRGYTVSGA